jgi:hypothetical protein
MKNNDINNYSKHESDFDCDKVLHRYVSGVSDVRMYKTSQVSIKTIIPIRIY